LTRVRDVGRLDQHRGDGWGFEHHEAGALHLHLADLADALERTHDALGGTRAHADNLLLRGIDQYRPQRTVIERYPAHEIRRVLAVGESLGRLTRCAVHREYVHGGARHAAVGDGVGVHRDEHVGVRRARSRDAVPELDELIAIAREHRVHPGLGVDALG